ncbi:tyrosine-type recombinase/integrase [Pseudomonadota bacterium]
MILHNTLVKTLEPPKKGYILIYDEHKDSPAGFGLRITAKGTRSFILRYNVGGRDRRMTIGQVPTWSLAAARKQAKAYRRETDSGTDVVEERQIEREKPTVAVAVDNFCKEQFDGLKSGKASRSRLERFFVSEHGSSKLHKVGRPEIKAIVLKVAKTHGRQAALLLTNLKSFYAWAEEGALVEANPVATMKPAKVAKSMVPVKRKRVLDEEEIRAFWSSAETCGIHKYTTLALKLVLVTGARPGEVAGMKWSEINGKTWTIPGARRGKTGTEHIVPLTDTALTLLKEAKAEAKRLAGRRRRKGSDFVFETRKNQSLQTNPLSKAVSRHQKELGNKNHVDWGNWRPHDLRRTFRTGLSAERVPMLVAELAIGHGKEGMVDNYDIHEYASEIREAHEAWERRLIRIIDGKPGDGGKVVPIRRERQA